MEIPKAREKPDELAAFSHFILQMFPILRIKRREPSGSDFPNPLELPELLLQRGAVENPLFGNAFYLIQPCPNASVFPFYPN